MVPTRWRHLPAARGAHRRLSVNPQFRARPLADGRTRLRFLPPNFSRRRRRRPHQSLQGSSGHPAPFPRPIRALLRQAPPRGTLRRPRRSAPNQPPRHRSRPSRHPGETVAATPRLPRQDWRSTHRAPRSLAGLPLPPDRRFWRNLQPHLDRYRARRRRRPPVWPPTNPSETRPPARPPALDGLMAFRDSYFPTSMTPLSCPR